MSDEKKKTIFDKEINSAILGAICLVLAVVFIGIAFFNASAATVCIIVSFVFLAAGVLLCALHMKMSFKESGGIAAGFVILLGLGMLVTSLFPSCSSSNSSSSSDSGYTYHEDPQSDQDLADNLNYIESISD